MNGGELKRIELPEFQGEAREPTGRTCPSCGRPLLWGHVPCPEGRVGCLVLHYGYQCEACKAYWE